MDRKVYIFVIVLLSLLVLRVFYFYTNKKDLVNGQDVEVKARILSDPKINGGYQNFSVLTDQGDTLFTTVESFPVYSYGQEIVLTGKVESKVLKNKNKISTIYKPKISLVKNRENDFLAGVNFIRQNIINSFRKTLPDNSSSLLLGMVFGIKDNMEKNFSDNLRSVGVTHVIAASGMNVTLLAGFVFYLFSVFFKRQVGILLSILSIVFYVFLSGFQPSIIRAAIMGIIAFSAQGLGKQQYSLYALFLTAFVMLFVWPPFLKDIGFQLSFVSTLGLILIPPLFKNFQNAFTEDLLTTVSAQLATMPILLSNFGNYSLWSILVNALVLWTVPILMILGGVAALVSFVFKPLADFILFLCLPFLIYFEKIVNLFSSFGGTVTIDSLPWPIFLSYYFFLASIILFVRLRSNE